MYGAVALPSAACSLRNYSKVEACSRTIRVAFDRKIAATSAKTFCGSPTVKSQALHAQYLSVKQPYRLSVWEPVCWIKDTTISGISLSSSVLSTASDSNDDNAFAVWILIITPCTTST